MAEQGYEYEQYAPQTSGRLFSSSMFGFNKEEVLEYLDELADENYQRQEAADMQIQELTQQVQNLQGHLENMQQNYVPEMPEGQYVDEGQYQQMAGQYEQVAGQYEQVLEQLEIANAATQQAEGELAELREQMFNARQENDWLRAEFSKTDAQIAELNRQLDAATSGQWKDLDEKEQERSELQADLDEKDQELQRAQTQIEELKTKLDKALSEQKRANPSGAAAASIIADANAEAERIRAMANDEKDRVRRQIRSSAGGIAESIGNLKGDVSGVENNVTQVLENVQGALTEVLAALNRTEQNLNTLGIQVERFPTSSPAVAKQQVVYFQPAQQEETGLPASRRTSRNASMPESYGTAGFRRVTGGAAPAASSKTRPFKPTFSNSPTTQANYWPQNSGYYDGEAGEDRMRALAENLVDTLMQMMK